MRAFTAEQRNYEDIHPAFLPFNRPTSHSSDHLESGEFDSDYLIIILLVALLLSEGDSPIKLF